MEDDSEKVEEIECVGSSDSDSVKERLMDGVLVRDCGVDVFDSENEKLSVNVRVGGGVGVGGREIDTVDELEMEGVAESDWRVRVKELE